MENKTIHISDEEVLDAQRESLEVYDIELSYQEAFEECINGHVEKEHWSKIENED